MVLATLKSLDCGFIVKSKNEILLAMSPNICLDPAKIMFKNEMLMASHLKIAAKYKVGLVAFESTADLNKIKKNYPDAR